MFPRHVALGRVTLRAIYWIEAVAGHAPTYSCELCQRAHLYYFDASRLAQHETLAARRRWPGDCAPASSSAACSGHIGDEGHGGARSGAAKAAHNPPRLGALRVRPAKGAARPSPGRATTGTPPVKITAISTTVSRTTAKETYQRLRRYRSLRCGNNFAMRTRALRGSPCGRVGAKAKRTISASHLRQPEPQLQARQTTGFSFGSFQASRRAAALPKTGKPEPRLATVLAEVASRNGRRRWHAYR
jgi:hypothetical protein